MTNVKVTELTVPFLPPPSVYKSSCPLIAEGGGKVSFLESCAEEMKT